MILKKIYNHYYLKIKLVKNFCGLGIENDI
jgi:hypothetical protein